MYRYLFCALTTLLAWVCISGVVTAYHFRHDKSFGFEDDLGVGNHFPSYSHDVDVDWVKPSNPFLIPKYVIQPKQDYSYTEQGGVSGWPAVFSECGGSSQSPVDINTFSIHRKHVRPLVFRDYWDNENTILINNTGKHAKVTLQGNFTMPTISGGPFSDEYTFDQLHFHWGADNDEGSEHTVDLESFSMEAHVVHFKSSYGTLTEAANHEDGLAVVAFFLQAIKNKKNEPFDDLVTHLRKVKKAYSTVKLPSASVAFNWFKDMVWGDYATYAGSLTTPPCSEIVTWLVYTRPCTASTNQINEFRALRSSDGSKIKTNYRQVQRYVVPGLYGPKL